jgi:PAS domain S-box-containing protein
LPVCREGEVAKDIGPSVMAPTPLTSIARSSRERDELLALAEHSAGIGVWDIDLTTGTARGTEQFFRIMGLAPRDEPISMDHIRALRHPDDRAKVVDGFRRALDSGANSYEVEYRVIHADGSIHWIFGRGRIMRDEHGAASRYSGVDIDITERKNAEAALAELNRELEERVQERTLQLEAEAARRVQAETLLLQAQKMEAVGQLTGGIAHDFNNLLTVIIGNLENMRRRLARSALDAAELDRLADQALVGAQRAAWLTQHLLAFARRQPLEPKALNANALVSGMSDLLKRTLGEGVVVQTKLAEDLWPCFVDANQLEVSLLNLAVNARHAMGDGGKLTIETRNLVHSGGGQAWPAELVPGDYVQLSVTDSGHGMSKQVLERAFEPFFTTKGIGKGTGLGLSQVYGFAKQSGGGVEIESAEGRGTQVKLYLPRLAQEMVQPVAPEPVSKPIEAGRAESVLVVEDEFLLRLNAVETLQELGYKVFEAADAAQALDMLLREPRIALMFSDIGLPGGMNGCQLAREAHKRFPQLKIVLTSGYAEQALLKDGQWDASIPLLNKPYEFEALAGKLREALDS